MIKLFKQHIFILNLVFILFSCSNNVQENKNASNQNFEVSFIKASKSKYSVFSANLKTPQVFKTQLEIQVKQNGLNQVIDKEFFTIEYDGTTKILMSDDNGIIHLDYFLKFSFASKEHFVKKVLTIYATNLPSAKCKINIAIDPWDLTPKSFKDLRHEHIEKVADRVESFNNVSSSLINTKKLLSHKIFLKNVELKTINNLIDLRSSINNHQYRINYSFNADPFLYRTSLQNKLIQEQIASGSLMLDFSIINKNQNKIIFSGNKLVTIMDGTINSLLKINLQEEDLPESSEEIFFVFKIKAPDESNLAASFISIDMSGVGVNRSSHTKIISKYIYEKNITTDSEIGQKTPSVSNIKTNIFLDNIELRHKGIGNKFYYVDKNLQLTVEKKYHLRFKPQLISYDANQATTISRNLPLNKKYNIHTFILNNVGSNGTVEESLEHLNLKDYGLIGMSSVFNKSPNLDGSFDLDLGFKFNTTELLALAFKNKFVIRLESTDEKYKSNFYAVNFVLKSGNLSTHMIELKDFTSSDMHELYSKQKEEKKMSVKDIDIYKNYIKTMDGLFYDGNLNGLETFNKNNFSKYERKNAVSKITIEDLYLLDNVIEKAPNQILRKFCIYLYPVKKKSKHLNIFGVKSIFENNKGTEFYKCMLHPAKFVNFKATRFVYPLVNKDNKQRAQIVESVQGKMSAGESSFALYGQRSSVSEGNRRTSDETISSSFGLWHAINGLFLSVSRSFDNTKSVYQVDNYSKMYAYFNRQYNSLEKVSLEYNQISLRFRAKVKKCITFFNDKFDRSMLLCQNYIYRNELTKESWYLIAQINNNQASLLTDGVVKDFSSYNQIIRGKNNFDKFQKLFSRKSSVVAVRAIGGVDSKNALYPTLTSNLEHYREKSAIKDNKTIHFILENDGEFPGLISY